MSAQTGADTVTHTVLKTRLGELTVAMEGGKLTGLYFPGHRPAPDWAGFGTRADQGFEGAARQVEEYLDGRRESFDLPLKVKGTEFEQRVWHLIGQVPYGHTTTYGDLARQIGEGTSPRAVGAAVGKNPLCIIIPCHRVIGSTGKLTGYAGGLDRKRALLDIEQESRLAVRRAIASCLF